MSLLPSAPAALRNRGHILEIVSTWINSLRGRDTATKDAIDENSTSSSNPSATSADWETIRCLEVASGTGEHIELLGEKMEGAVWQPSDLGNLHHLSERTRQLREEGKVLLPITLDTRVEEDWDAIPWVRKDAAIDLILCVNMLHISPWESTVGLIRHSGRVLRDGGLLMIYGPFLVDGKPTTPSNANFDASLRSSDPSWGIRDEEVVSKLGEDHSLCKRELIPMPANNFILILQKKREMKE